MKSQPTLRILFAGTLASLLFSGCGSPSVAQSITPASADIEATMIPEATQTGTPTAQASSTPESAPISYPFQLGTPLPPVTVKISVENAANIIEVANWNIKSVRKFIFSPDGETMLIGTTSGDLLLVRISDGSLVQTFEGHTKGVADVVYSPDGQFIVSASLDQTARVWKAGDGSIFHVLEGHEDGLTSVAISPDGQTIASGSLDNTIRIWNFKDGKLLRTISGDFIGAVSLAFSADGAALASGGTDDTARVWNPVTGNLIRTFKFKPIIPGESYTVEVAYSPDGTLLAARHAYTGNMTLYNVADYSVNVTMPVPGLKNSNFVFSPDGQMLITGARDSGLNFVNIADGATLKNIVLGNIKCVAISPDGTLVAVMGADYAIHVWGLEPQS